MQIHSEPPTLHFSYPRNEKVRTLNLSDNTITYVSIDKTLTPNILSSTTRIELCSSVQAVPTFSDQNSQTFIKQLSEMSTQYEPNILVHDQGGDDSLAAFLRKVQEIVEPALLENALTYNSTQDLFAALIKQQDEEFINANEQKMELIESQSFADLRYKSKSVSYMEWHPEISDVFAMSSCSRVTLDERIEQSFQVKTKQSVISFWSVNSPHKPLLFLNAPDDVLVFKFHPGNCMIVVAGCVGGQAVVWDISEYAQLLRVHDTDENSKSADNRLTLRGDYDPGNSAEAPFVTHSLLCAIDGGHRAPIIDLLFVPTEYCINKMAKTRDVVDSLEQFLTSSLDGRIMVWEFPDKKRFVELFQTWKPMYQFNVQSPDSSIEYGCTRMTILYRKPADIQKSKLVISRLISTLLDPMRPVLFVGTEGGDIVSCNWNTDFLKDKNNHVEVSYPAHLSYVASMKAAPLIIDYLASIGGKTLMIWNINSMVQCLASF